MNTPPPASPRRRLQELLSIPDGQRSEAEWDELHELEISLAPGNRLDGKPYRQDAPPKQPRPPRHTAPKPKPAGDGGGNAVVNGSTGGGGGGESKRGFRRRRPKGPKPAEPGSQ